MDHERVRDAIAAAELETTAPIHVSIAPYFWGDVQRTAERALRKHGLTRAPKRNSVLLSSFRLAENLPSSATSAHMKRLVSRFGTP